MPKACPGLSTAGNAGAEMENPAPETVREFTLSAVVPDEVSVRFLANVELSATLPNARLLALSVNCGAARAIPVPPRAMVVITPLAELLEIVIFPTASPVTVGPKFT